LLIIATAPAGTSAQTSQRCFPETGFCIEGRIREFWEQNGALPVFGLPITPLQQELIEGRPLMVQWFERNRLELHPENNQPYDVLLGRLGDDRLREQGQDWHGFPTSNPQAGCRFFPETGHNVCGDILQAWRANGLELDQPQGNSEAENLALFGLPLNDPQTETIEGKEYTVQWFERARFEIHPENASPYNVLLGLLGRDSHPPVCQPDPAKYGFEPADVLWQAQTYVDSQAITAVAHSEKQMAMFGCYSLKLMVDLIAGDANKSKGEAWIDMRGDNAPKDEQIPAKLTNRTITAWVYAPPGVGGDKDRPNGFQIFVKDQKFRNEYGSWHNVIEGQWAQISLTVSDSEPVGGFKDLDFDPSQIIVVGVKIDTGDGSTTRYQGLIYVDAVRW
jgi:hypothetical protein